MLWTTAVVIDWFVVVVGALGRMLLLDSVLFQWRILKRKTRHRFHCVASSAVVGTGCAIVGLVLLPRGGSVAHALARQELNRLSHSFLVRRGEERGVARVGPEDGAILGKNSAFCRPRLEVDSDARKLLPSALSISIISF